MFSILKKMFASGKETNYVELVKQGAIILDVRSKGEYASGHIKGSINIPVDALGNSLNQLKDKNKPIITCCASGMRSAAAKSVLQKNGYQEVYNGGGWVRLQNNINKT